VTQNNGITKGKIFVILTSASDYFTCFKL